MPFCFGWKNGHILVWPENHPTTVFLAQMSDPKQQPQTLRKYMKIRYKKLGLVSSSDVSGKSSFSVMKIESSILYGSMCS